MHLEIGVGIVLGGTTDSQLAAAVLLCSEFGPGFIPEITVQKVFIHDALRRTYPRPPRGDDALSDRTEKGYSDHVS